MIRTRTIGFVRRTALGVVLPALTLSGVAVLGACGTPEAGSAAVVGSRRVSVSDVQSATTDIMTFFGAGQSVAQQQVLFFLISGPFIVDAAAKAGVGVSTDDARAQLVTKVGSPTPAAISVFQANLALSRIGQLGEAAKTQTITGLQAAIGSAHVTVNPRYGSFDTKSLNIVPAVQNWMVSAPPSASPEPSPAPS